MSYIEEKENTKAKSKAESKIQPLFSPIEIKNDLYVITGYCYVAGEPDDSGLGVMGIALTRKSAMNIAKMLAEKEAEDQNIIIEQNKINDQENNQENDVENDKENEYRKYRVIKISDGFVVCDKVDKYTMEDYTSSPGGDKYIFQVHKVPRSNIHCC